jgi:pimeloyl-ACP methyl ester carboxylesterase
LLLGSPRHAQTRSSSVILKTVARLPETHYAKGPGGNIAYQVVGDGPVDLVIIPGFLSHVDLLWGDPGWAGFIDDLASFARVVLYDKPGRGLSDPVDGVLTLERRADALRAVLDAAGCRRAAMFGLSEGGPISLLFAATYPDRVRSLIVYGSYACGARVDDGSLGRRKSADLMNTVEETLDRWGGGTKYRVGRAEPSHSAVHRRAVGALERAAMSPKMARLMLEAVLTQVDVRDILSRFAFPRGSFIARATPALRGRCCGWRANAEN